MEHLIRWSSKDDKRLAAAVRKFNSVVGKLSNPQLPTTSLPELKDQILTRKELNRQIKKLNSITLENADTWLNDQLQLDIRAAKRRLTRKLKSLPKGDFMGNDEYYFVEGELQNINKLNDLPTSFKERKIKRINDLASSDFEMKQAKNYRDWYIRSIDEFYSQFKGYDKLKKKLESIKNPITFYNMIKGFVNEADINYLRYQLQNQAFFNRILNAWGLDEEDETEFNE